MKMHTPFSTCAFLPAFKIPNTEIQPTAEAWLDGEENHRFAPLANGSPSRGKWVKSSPLEWTMRTEFNTRNWNLLVFVCKLLSSNYGLLWGDSPAVKALKSDNLPGVQPEAGLQPEADRWTCTF